MLRLAGIPISSGYGSGIAVVYDFEIGRTLEMTHRQILDSEVQSEWERLDVALEQSSQDLRTVELAVSNHPNLGESQALLQAHSAMTSEIVTLVKEQIGRNLVNVEKALESVICDWAERLQRLDNEFLRQREQDVRDVGRRITRHLAGSLPLCKGPLPQGSVIVARELMPSEAIELASCGVVAIVSEYGGKFSHTAIVARSLGIPAVTGIIDATSRIHPGMRLLVDGQTGSVVIAPSESDEISFAKQKEEYEGLIAEIELKPNLPCITQDDIPVSLLANIGLPEEIGGVAKYNLAGIGLCRTEFLFMEAQQRPSVQLQSEIYGQMARALDGLPLVIRTFDLGGDKLPPFLLSENPETISSLHLRGLRFSLAERNLLDSQLNAILQVAQMFDVRIMFPMVIGSDDLARGIEAVERVVEQSGVLRTLSLGAMIETPAALYDLDRILDLVDFVALGTNDLTQYMLATDRDLPEQQDDCTALHPAVLRAIKQVVVAAEKRQCPVYACGDEAGDIGFASILVGLGIRELSLSPERASVVCQAIRSISVQQAREIAEHALQCRTPAEVRELLAALPSSGATQAATTSGATCVT